MTTIIEAVESSFKEGKDTGSHAWDAFIEEPMGVGVNNDLEGNDVAVENDNVGIEVENPNPEVHEPTIEISSDSDVKPEADGEMTSEPHQDEGMEEDSDPEEEFDE